MRLLVLFHLFRVKFCVKEDKWKRQKINTQLDVLALNREYYLILGMDKKIKMNDGANKFEGILNFF